MYINKNNSTPIYIQIKKDLEQKIKEGYYKSHDKIPSERILSEEYDVSRMTVRQAVTELVNEKKLYREQGRGTFVSAPQFLQENLKSFTKTLMEKGHTPKTKIIEFEVVTEIKHISKMLDLDLQTKYYKIKRLRYADSTPVALETIYIPEKFCRGIEKFDMTKSFYSILEEEYGYNVDMVSCEMDALISDKYLMKIFEVNRRVPLLKVSGINYANDHMKLFFETSYYRSDIYKYQVDLFKRAMDMKVAKRI